MNAISLNHLWSYLQGLSLTASNQRWLASRLMEAAENTMTLEPLPKGVDLERGLVERAKQQSQL